MPKLDDILSKKKKPFKKRSYRPWDLNPSRENEQLEKEEAIPGQLAAKQSPVQKDIIENTNIQKIEINNVQCDLENDKNNIALIKGYKQGTDTANIGYTKGTQKKQIGNKQSTQRVQTEYNKEYTVKNLSPTMNDVTDLVDDVALQVYTLTGIQQQLLKFIVSICLKRGGLETGILISSDMINALGIKANTCKVSLNRLKKKGLIIRRKGKCARAGFLNIAVTPEVRDLVRDRFIYADSNSINGASIGYNSGYNETIYSSSRKPTTTNLPKDWEKIDLSSIQKVFKNLSGKAQTFGRKQLFIIFERSGNILSASDVQNTLDQFAYGLENFSNEERYSSIKSPGGLLFNQLSAGDVWSEPRFLSIEEQSLHAVYLNLKINSDNDMDIHFERWLSQDKEKKYKHYEKKMGSTQYYDDRVFREIAKDDFDNEIWPRERRKYILQMLGEDKKLLVMRFEEIDAIKEN